MTSQAIEHSRGHSPPPLWGIASRTSLHGPRPSPSGSADPTRWSRPIRTEPSGQCVSEEPWPGTSPAAPADWPPWPSSTATCTAISANYASRSRDGIHDLLDIETPRATADVLADLSADLDAGAGISGPAARRAINAAAHAPTFAGAILTARQARDLLGNPALAVHDNPGSLLLCVYDPRKALCQKAGAHNAPRLEQCVATCANISRTDQHAAQLLVQAEKLEKQAATELTPLPLAERLRGLATHLRDQADKHHRHRIPPRKATHDPRC